jgi:hypothetical protein
MRLARATKFAVSFDTPGCARQGGRADGIGTDTASLYRERKTALRRLPRHDRGIQYVEHAEGRGDKCLLPFASSA